MMKEHLMDCDFYEVFLIKWGVVKLYDLNFLKIVVNNIAICLSLILYLYSFF